LGVNTVRDDSSFICFRIIVVLKLQGKGLYILSTPSMGVGGRGEGGAMAP